MIKIIRERNTKKTYDLMKICLDNNGYFVCSDPARYQHKAENYNLYGLNCISYNDYLTSASNENIYYIDDLDLFIQTIPNIGGFDMNID